MSDQATLEAIETLELIVSADTARLSSDPFKLPSAGAASLRQVCVARLADLQAKSSGTALSSGAEASAQAVLRRALVNLEKAHRAGYKWIAGLAPLFLAPDQAGVFISDAERANVFEAYGFAGGLVGEFTDARRLDLARQAPIATAAVGNTGWTYPAPLLLFIATELGLADGAQLSATGGGTGVAMEARNVARELATDIIARVRFHYCAASDDGDRTAELRKIGMQPRRAPGEAIPAPLPGPTGPATHDAAARTITIAALPEHATSVRAYRQVLGGAKVLAGTSTETPVSYAEASPLEAGATYEVWVAGHNAEGDGPESEHFTAVG